MLVVHQFMQKGHGLDLDLNLPPSPEATLSDCQSTGNDSSDFICESKRAEHKVASKIQLEDLTQYFDLPIKDASKHLKVGLTVLKKKCREFGIPRWPHRKLKCLDGLINTLEEEVERQLQDNKDVAIAMANKKRMLESEKGTLKRKPFMELQSETKRLRQDVYKRRFLARTCKKLVQEMGSCWGSSSSKDSTNNPSFSGSSSKSSTQGRCKLCRQVFRP